MLSSLGLVSEVALRFERADDVPQGGVLCALPALLAMGLLRGVRQVFSWAKGYYPMEAIFLALAFLALARVRSLEALRYESPGEWGKLLGLDRIPEVKTLRSKIGAMTERAESTAQWGSQLAKEWMEANGEHAGYYYIDGHVRVYHGSVAQRPRAYVAREQLCLRATLDYWVNAMDGQPFFVITQELNERLIQTIQTQIVPRLKAQAPGQPTEQELQGNRWLHRFVMVFDREGYSPAFFKQMLQERIAVISYAKRSKRTEAWPEDQFSLRTVRLINGEQISLWMAERGVCLSNGLWVREIRHRDQAGHQTAILSTDFITSLEKVAAALFARWCQENFFRYMMEHFGLDRLVQYGAEPIPETKLVVNPARRTLENQIRRQRALLSRDRAQLGAKVFPKDVSPAAVGAFEREQGELLERIGQREHQIKELIGQRKDTPKHVPLKDLPPQQRYTRLRGSSKHFVDTIKMIAYRAETALVGLARKTLQRSDDARALLRQILTSSVNLIPDQQHKRLTVEIHPLTNPAHNQALRDLCAQLTETETKYPTTDLQLVYRFLGPS